VIDQLSPEQQDNVLRVHIAAEQRAALAGQPFEMSLDDTADFVADFGGLNDPTFIMPAGLVGKWIE
jgi:hypothetical protein